MCVPAYYIPGGTTNAPMTVSSVPCCSAAAAAAFYDDDYINYEFDDLVGDQRNCDASLRVALILSFSLFFFFAFEH